MTHKDTKIKYDTLIIGGGISGITACYSLLNKKKDVVLIEKSSHIGGRAFSFFDPSTKEIIDNGQHVIVGACKNFINLISDLGLKNKIVNCKNFHVPVVAGGKTSYLGSRNIPSIVGLAWSIISYSHLKKSDRFKVIFGLLKILMSDIEKETNKHKIFRDWLKDNKQNSSTIKYFWNIIIKPALNDHIEKIDTKYALFVIKKTFLQSQKNLFLGYPSVALSDLWQPIEKKMSSSKSSTIKKGRVKKLILENNLITSAELSNGEVIQANTFVTTIPQKDLFQLFKESGIGIDSKLNKKELNNSPIVGIHFWFDKLVMKENYLASADGETQWIFNVSKNHQEKNYHIVISQSAAWNWINQEKEDLKNIFLKEITKILPQSKHAKLLKYSIVKQPNATFRCTPGSDESRDIKLPSIENLFISGDWTKTRWPSTMESAVISGNKVANTVLNYMS